MVGFLRHSPRNGMGGLCLWKDTRLFSKVAARCYIPTSSGGGLQFLCSLSNFVIFCFFCFSFLLSPNVAVILRVVKQYPLGALICFPNAPSLFLFYVGFPLSLFLIHMLFCFGVELICNVALVPGVQRSDIGLHTRISIHSFFRFFSHRGDYKILSNLAVLDSTSLWINYFIQSSLCLFIPAS